MLCLFISCEKAHELQPNSNKNQVKEQEIIARLEARHEKMQEDFLDNESSFNQARMDDMLAAQVYSKELPYNATELKVAPLVSMALSWWFTESCNWLYEQGLDKYLGSLFGDAAESNEDYTCLLNNVPNMVKIKDGDALMISAKLDAQRYRYIESAEKLEDALANYLSALPNSAAHVLPCLKAIEAAYQKASIKNGSHNLGLFCKYSTWAYDCYRLAYKEMKASDYKQIEAVVQKAGGKYLGLNGLKDILMMSSAYWMPQGMGKFRSLPGPASRCQMQVHDYRRNDLRMHNKTLIREGAYYKPCYEPRLNYCQIKRNWENHYQFVWKDDKQKAMGLCYRPYQAKFGNTYKTSNWVEMKYDHADQFIWTLVPYGRDQFMLVHKNGMIYGGDFNSKCFLVDGINSLNKSIILDILPN